MKTSVAALLGTVLAFCSLHANATQFYVSPSGHDANPGSRQRPFATLLRAQQAVREAKVKGPVTVHLRVGIYHLSEPLVLTADDSGTARAPIVYAAATGEAAGLRLLVEMRGTAEKPVQFVTLRNLRFTGTAPTFLETKEPLLRGDWCIYRGGAVLIEGAEEVALRECCFESLGGNAVFLSRYNRRVTVSGCRFADVGASAVCLVGDPAAVRSPQYWNQSIPEEQIDLTPGPRSQDYPAQCLIEDNLMHDLGQVEKQVAGVFISMAREITVRHNTIYHIPRAAICINDGTWGGHLIEDNDAFDTVRETGDHGPFNSWGRDRHWTGSGLWSPQGQARSCLDSFLPTIIRHNRFTHWGSHSWGIDLDDGSSHYEVRDNLCLGCSVKLREGYFRTVENNIFVGPHPPGKHCCYLANQDVIRRNIFVNTASGAAHEMIHARPAEMKEIDENLYFNTRGAAPIVKQAGTVAKGFKSEMTLAEWQAKGLDRHSLFADPQFVSPERGDFRVTKTSPALGLGFHNFAMNDFGVTSKALRKEAAEGHRQFDRAPGEVVRLTVYRAQKEVVVEVATAEKSVPARNRSGE